MKQPCKRQMSVPATILGHVSVFIEAKTTQSWLAVLIKNNKQVAKYYTKRHSRTN